MPYNPPWVEPGWPNLPDQGQVLVNAFATGVNMNLKKQELQGKLQTLVEKNRQLEFMDQLRENQFQERERQDAYKNNMMFQRLDWDKAKAQQNAGFAQQRADIAWDTLGLHKAAFDKKNADEETRTQGMTDLFNAEASLPQDNIHPGDQNYEEEWFRRTADAKAPPAAKSAAARIAMTNHAAATRNKQKEYDASLKGFRERFGSDIFGNPQIQDTQILDSPESLPSAFTPARFWWETTKIDPTKRIVTTVSPAGAATTKIIPLTKLKQYQKEYQDILSGGKTIPILHDHSDIGVYNSTSSTLRQRALQLQNDPTASNAAKMSAEQWLKDNP